MDRPKGQDTEQPLLSADGSARWDAATFGPVSSSSGVAEPRHSGAPVKKGRARQGVGAGAAGLAIAAKVGLLKLLLTFGSLIVSVVIYSAGYGLPFAIGLVALLFFHEAGHWIAFRRKGITPSAMIFIPFIGAAVIARRTEGLSAFDDVVISLAGPVLGGLAAAACLVAAYLMPANGPFLVSLAGTGFLINLINLIPFGPLDGAHILRAIVRSRPVEQEGGGHRALAGVLAVATACLLIAGFAGVRGNLGDALAEGAALFHVYSPPTPLSSPDGVAVNAAGIVWFTELNTSKIGRIDPKTGTIREFDTPTRHGEPLRITPGPDGAMWFTEAVGNVVGRIADNGTIDEFRLPTAGAWPWDIVAGPDGDLYFVEHDAARIGRITTSGYITEYPLAHGRNPSGMTVGPDGALWFMEDDGASRGVGRITTRGIVSEYTLPVKDSGPQMITTGQDGSLYATLVKDNAIVRITPGGSGVAMTVFTLPAPPTAQAGQPANTTNQPYSLVAGPGGIWSTEYGENALARLAPDGTFSEYLAFAGSDMKDTFPSIIARAPDGTLWFTASDSKNQNSRIVHLSGVPGALDAGS